MDEQQEIKAFFYEKGREEPLSKVGWWILLRWVLLGVTILASLTSNFLLNLNLPLALHLISLPPGCFFECASPLSTLHP